MKKMHFTDIMHIKSTTETAFPAVKTVRTIEMKLTQTVSKLIGGIL